MQTSDEEENFIKITKLVLDIFPKYLRKCFIKQWNIKYPNQTWQSDNTSGTFFFNSLPPKVKANKSRQVYIEKLKEGNEQEWDTTTVVYALLETGLQLVEGSRPKDQRNDPLRISEQIEIIRHVRNFVAHASSMSCSSTEFTEKLTEIKSKAIDIFDTYAVQEIEDIETSQIESQMAGELKKQLEVEKQRSRDFDELFKYLKEVKEETNEKFCKVDEKVGKVDEKVGSVDEKVGKVDEKVGKVDEKVGKVDEKVGRVDENIGKVDEKVEKMQIDVDKLKVLREQPKPYTEKDIEANCKVYLQAPKYRSQAQLYMKAYYMSG